MQTEYDENMLDKWNLPNGNHIVKLKKNGELEGDNDLKNALPSHLGAFISSKIERNMNNLIREINGISNNNFYYGDTGSVYIEKK